MDVAGIAGTVAIAAATLGAAQIVVRLNWEFRDRRIKKRDQVRPVIETFTLAEMREEIGRLPPKITGPMADATGPSRIGRAWLASRIAAGAYVIHVLARNARLSRLPLTAVLVTIIAVIVYGYTHGDRVTAESR
jgi:hypothetical protein